MSGLDTNKGKSKTPFNEAGQNFPAPRREYSPDFVIAPMVAEVRKTNPALNDFRFLLSRASEPRFALQESKALIVAALDEFDANLGNKARDIFQTAHYRNGAADIRAEAQYKTFAFDSTIPETDNPFLSKEYKLEVNEGARWNLTPVPPGQCRLMRCLPAESEQKEWTPTAYDPANPHSQAVIEYQFDGTVDAVVHMAHELGHAIADDCGREAGHNHRDNPEHIAEMQAYLTQHVLYDYLKRHPDGKIADAARRHFDATISQNLHDLQNDPSMEGRPMSILTIRGLHDHLRQQDADTRRRVNETLLGRDGPRNINEVLAASGIESQDDMKALARLATQSPAHASPDACVQKPAGVEMRL